MIRWQQEISGRVRRLDEEGGGGGRGRREEDIIQRSGETRGDQSSLSPSDESIRQHSALSRLVKPLNEWKFEICFQILVNLIIFPGQKNPLIVKLRLAV